MILKYLIVYLFLLTSCVHGPQSERKSPLNYLSGEHYETNQVGGVDTLIVPLVKRKAKATKIEGTVLMKADMLSIPLRYQSVVLLNAKGKELQQINTNSEGKFTFTARLKNGAYKIKIKSKKYSGLLSFNIKSYNVDKLTIIATKK